jgi:hypothetical protein
MAERIKNESKFDKGRRGIAEIVRLNETMVRVDFDATDVLPAESFNVNVSYGEDGTVPDYIPLKKIKDGSKFPASVTMNKAGTAILFAVPSSGFFEVKFDSFLAPEGQEPVIETKEGKLGKDGKKRTYGKFACLLEITGGTWQGLTIKKGVWAGAKYWFGLYDNFTQGVEGGLAVGGAGTGSDNLNDFLDAVVAGGSSIQYTENPLPEIQKLAKELDSRFNVNVHKGWVESISVPLSAGEMFVDEEELDADKDFPKEGLSEAQKANVTIHKALEDE